MIKVRFPNGNLVEYVGSSFAKYTSFAVEIYTANPDDGGRWMASVPNESGALIETSAASSVRIRKPPAAITLDAATRAIETELPNVNYWDRHKITSLKRALHRFNCKTGAYR